MVISRFNSKVPLIRKFSPSPTQYISLLKRIPIHVLHYPFFRMSGNKADELEYYSQQIVQTEALMLEKPSSAELKQLLENLKSTYEKLLQTDDEETIPGRTCEVFYEGKWFNAETVSARTDIKGDEKIIVKLLGKEQAREYPLSEVKFLQKASHQQFPKGSRVQAIWKPDGLWYNATVLNLCGSGDFVIQFDGFECEPDTVSADRVRQPVVFRPKVKPKEEKTYTTPAGYVIPEKLKIDPTKDTSSSIAEKKRKIHHLKSQQRSEKHVDEITHNKSKWMQFQQKSAQR